MKRLGIIGAMDVEISLLRERMANPASTQICGLEFISGSICGVDSVLVKCGVGKVNAALCAQVLIDRFNVTHIINTGAAGAFAKGLGVLDIVISTEVVYHDVDATAWGYEPCTLPGMPLAFEADKVLVQAAYTACKESFPQRNCLCGRIASGDQFISSSEQKNTIRKLCNPACVEMEGAAIGHVCVRNGIPFVILRSMSDMADETAVPDSADRQAAEFNEKTAGETSASLVTAMLGKL